MTLSKIFRSREVLKLKKLGGVIRNRVFYNIASLDKKPGEKLDVYGPFEISNRKYPVAVYYPSKLYYWTLIRGFPFYFGSILYRKAILHAPRYGHLIQGLKVLSMDSKTVPYEASLYTKAYRFSQIWLDAYLTPFFDPNLRRVEIHLKFVRKSVESLRKRKYPKAATEAERRYIERLRIADRQVIDNQGILEQHFKVAKNVVSGFQKISDKPTEQSILQLRQSALALQKTLRRMSQWCTERADSWPAFADAFILYKSDENERKSFLKRYGLRALFDSAAALIIGLVFQSPYLGALVTLIQDIGARSVVDLVFGTRSQVKRLHQAALAYESEAERVDKFLALYELKIPNTSFIRA